MPIRILIADDYSLFRAGMRGELASVFDSNEQLMTLLLK